MLASAKKNGMSLRWADATIKKDKEILEAAVLNTDGEAFIYADIYVKKDFEFVLKLVLKNAAIM